MLETLSVRDVVLIDRLELGFDRGLCALTGETGAGKSILLDALGLAMGARGAAGLVRKGAEKAVVTAQFDLPPGHAAHAILDAQGIDIDPSEPLILRRVLTADGRSRAFVNDQPVGVGLLKDIGETLVEIHGQFETQGLLNPRTHMDMLDNYAGLGDKRAATKAAWKNWRDAEKARKSAEDELAAGKQEEDFLRHTVKELEDLAPVPGEEDDLAATREALMHSEQVIAAMNEAVHLLTDDGGADDALGAAQGALGRVAHKAAGRLDDILATLEGAAAEIQDAVSRLNTLGNNYDGDGRSLEELEERLFTLRDCARKHGCAVDDLPQKLDELAARLARLDNSEAHLENLAHAAKAARAAYVEEARILSRKRQEIAAVLDEKVAAELGPLKMDKARFYTHVAALDEDAYGADGIDRVTFLVATNPGAEPGAIAKIASGGELARFMLALKVVLADTSSVPVLVFDEVDAGIGGAVADAVGERLGRLGERLQVLVVTHSPQVAARARHHWNVLKAEEGGAVTTRIHRLEEAERLEEVARMLAGAEITDEARAAASALMKSGRVLENAV